MGPLEAQKAFATPAAWDEPERAARLVARATESTGLDRAQIDHLLRLCAESADPDGALAGSLRALEARRARFGRPAAPFALEPLVSVCAASRFLASHLAARPRLVDLLALPAFAKRARGADDAREAAVRFAHARDAEALARRLRRHKLVEVLRIALRDLTGRASLPEVMLELSHFAAATFEAAIRFHYRRLCARHGSPEGRRADGPSGFCVLGMGKLGGDELNFSSDVDVLYVYDKDGRTQGPRALDHFAFYAKLAEEVTRTVGSPHATPQGGFVFRVDLDLRPEGRSGPIVNAQRALELYYAAQGAPWERLALLKARPIAGDLAVGQDALLLLFPFVWRRYLDLSAVDSMRALKARAEREAGRRGGLDLKLGPGGIREIEFFVQTLQLLYGGKDPNLRVRGTLPALDRLLFAGLISSRDRDELAEAYVFLRRLEHRVQMVAERQTHALPDDAPERGRLAMRAGVPGPRDSARLALERDLAQHRARVEARFRDLLRVAEGGAPEPDPRAATALDAQAAEEERIEALRALGFDDPEAAVAELHRLSRRRGSPFSPAAPLEFLEGAPGLLAELAAAPDPDQALRHLADLLSQLSEPGAVSQLLVASPRTARLLSSLFGSSDFLSRSLLRHPEMIEQLVQRGAAPPVRSRDELAAELSQRLDPLAGDAERQLVEMRRFHNEEVLRIGQNDVAGALTPEAVSEQLSDLADFCVRACLELARADVERRDGRPVHADGSPATLVVIALGKLGGRELGYHSDLDLLFLYSGPGETEGPRRAVNHEHFARVAQKLISHLTLQVREGFLYRIDTRLRPSGNAGPLVVSFEALASYHAREARLWERQALLRARAVAGDELLFARAQREVLQKSLFRARAERARREIARELFAMRERMEREIAGEGDGRYNFKVGRGGVVDVEFAVQFLQLAHGAEHPQVRIASTPRALSELARAGLLSAADHDALRRGYRFWRRLEGRMRIVRERPVHHLPVGRDLLLLARRLGYSGARAEEELRADAARTADSVRAAFLRVLGAA